MAWELPAQCLPRLRHRRASQGLRVLKIACDVVRVLEASVSLLLSSISLALGSANQRSGFCGHSTSHLGLRVKSQGLSDLWRQDLRGAGFKAEDLGFSFWIGVCSMASFTLKEFLGPRGSRPWRSWEQKVKQECSSSSRRRRRRRRRRSSSSSSSRRRSSSSSSCSSSSSSSSSSSGSSIVVVVVVLIEKPVVIIRVIMIAAIAARIVDTYIYIYI